MTRTTSDPQHLVTTAEHRAPTQERGTRRVGAILDAAAELVTEVGVEGITVQLLAERAETSKGSLYHFFPDVPSVLRALGERHLSEIHAIACGIVSDKSIDWPNIDAHTVVKHILTPLDYLEQNCDLLAIVRAPGILPRSSREMQPMLQFVAGVLAARFPDMPADRRATRTAMIVAMIDGVVATAGRGCAVGAKGMRHELEELLAIYVRGLG